MKVHVTYRLSDTGQRSALAAGSNASVIQEVPIDDPDNILLPHVHVDSNGTARIRMDTWKLSERTYGAAEYYDHNVSRTIYEKRLRESCVSYVLDTLLATVGEVLEAVIAFKSISEKMLATYPQVQAEADADFEQRKAKYISERATTALKMIEYGKHFDDYNNRQYVKMLPDFSPVLTAQCLEFNAETDRLFEAKQKAAEVKEEAKRKRQEAKDRAEQQKADEAKAIVDKRKADKATWITKHGSDFLKAAFADNYNCQRRYVEERAQMEFPGFIPVLSSDYLCISDCACPSEEKFKVSHEVTKAHPGYVCRVVWLEELNSKSSEMRVSKYPHSGVLEPCEALRVADYLGEYTLIKID